MSVIANVPKWQIELWDNIFERMRGPYDSWQQALKQPSESSFNKMRQEKEKICITKQWIQRYCPLYTKELPNTSFEKISHLALEAIAQTVISHEYEDTVLFQRFYGFSPFQEDEKKVEKVDLHSETEERINILLLWKEKPDLFLKTDYSEAKRKQNSPIPMYQGNR